MFRRAYLSLLVAVFVFAAVVWLDRKASADVPNGQAILVVSPTSMQSAPGPIIQASTQPVTITVTFSTTAPTPSDPEATVTSTGYTLTATVLCKGSLSGSYASPSADSGISLTLSPGNGPALSVTGSGSDATFTISGVFPVGAYYDISLSGTATFTDSDGNNYSVPASGNAYLIAANADILWAGSSPAPTDGTPGATIANGSSIKNQNIYAIIGGDVGLTGIFSPSDLPNVTQSWSIPGANGSASGSAEAIDPSHPWAPTLRSSQAPPPLSTSPFESTIHFFWTMPSNPGATEQEQVKYSVSYGGNTITAGATIGLECPSFNISQACDTTHLDNSFPPCPPPFIHTGFWDGTSKQTVSGVQYFITKWGVINTGTWGEKTSHFSTLDAGAQWTQTIPSLSDRYRFEPFIGRSYWAHDIPTTDALDTSVAYSPVQYVLNSDPAAPGTFVGLQMFDSPGTALSVMSPPNAPDALSDDVRVTITFSSYLLFEPSAVFGNLVPVGMVSWKYGGSAHYQHHHPGGRDNPANWPIYNGPLFLTPLNNGGIVSATVGYPTWTSLCAPPLTLVRE